jgi:hypothetical protein
MFPKTEPGLQRLVANFTSAQSPICLANRGLVVEQSYFYHGASGAAI